MGDEEDISEIGDPSTESARFCPAARWTSWKNSGLCRDLSESPFCDRSRNCHTVTGSLRFALYEVHLTRHLSPADAMPRELFAPVLGYEGALEMKIVVLAGGLSTERDVSFKSGDMVARALRRKGHQVLLLDVFMGYGDAECDISDIFDRAERPLSRWRISQNSAGYCGHSCRA